MSRLLIATTNRGKQEEFRRLLAALDADLVVPQDLGLDLNVPEPHDTYAENAAAKATAFATASGLISLADDSGIEIAALDWGPGVRSARWGGGRNAERVQQPAKLVLLPEVGCGDQEAAGHSPGGASMAAR